MVSPEIQAEHDHRWPIPIYSMSMSLLRCRPGFGTNSNHAKPTNLLLLGLKDNIITSGSIITAAGHHLQWQKVICFLRQLETNELRNNEITYSAAIVSCELATHEAAENKDPTAVCKQHRMWQKDRLTVLWARVEEHGNEVYTAVWLVWPCFAFNLMKMTLTYVIKIICNLLRHPQLFRKLTSSRFLKASGRLLLWCTQKWQSWFTCSTCSDLFSRSLARSSTVS